MAASLAERLGIGEGARVGVVNEPDGFFQRLGPLPTGVRLFERASEPLDIVVYFSDTLANIEKRVPLLAQYLAPSGALWMAYPRAGGVVETDISPEDITRIARTNRLVGESSIDLDDVWIAERLVPR